MCTLQITSVSTGSPDTCNGKNADGCPIDITINIQNSGCPAGQTGSIQLYWLSGGNTTPIPELSWGTEPIPLPGNVPNQGSVTMQQCWVPEPSTIGSGNVRGQIQVVLTAAPATGCPGCTSTFTMNPIGIYATPPTCTEPPSPPTLGNPCGQAMLVVNGLSTEEARAQRGERVSFIHYGFVLANETDADQTFRIVPAPAQVAPQPARARWAPASVRAVEATARVALGKHAVAAASSRASLHTGIIAWPLYTQLFQSFVAPGETITLRARTVRQGLLEVAMPDRTKTIGLCHVNVRFESEARDAHPKGFVVGLTNHGLLL
jgi:hypothetical protein